jgi:hypothetical protein
VLHKLNSHLTYANVVATLALFVALGGSSYAALKVTGKTVKDRSLTAKDIKKGSLTTTEVRDRSLLSKDFKTGQLPAGPQGPKGDKGDQGEPATKLFAYVRDTNGSDTAAVLEYGSHATGVSDPAGNNNNTTPYVVTFDRDLSHCVAHVTTGYGEPGGLPRSYQGSYPIAEISGSTVKASLFGPSGGTDTSFMLSVFC